MKKWKLLLPLLATALAGCTKQMTIEQYNEAKLYCETNNMKAVKQVTVTRYGGESKEVYGVLCEDSSGSTFPSNIK